jgi:beta-glucosidase
MALGEGAYMSGEASSRANINLPGVQSDLLAAIKKTGKPIVMVLLNGRPLTLEKESTMADAILEAWQPGSEGGHAVADVLFGKYNPSAKLPITFPRNVGQIPIFYNAKSTGRPFDPADPVTKYKSKYLDSPNDPLYPFGFGLSYTTFKYSKPQLSKTTIGPGDHLTVTVNIKNTGPVDGAEVAELYIHNRTGGVTHSVLELKGFQKVPLKAGESRDVTFTVGEPQLTSLLPDMTWGVAPGNYDVFVGSSSTNLQSEKIVFNKN